MWYIYKWLTQNSAGTLASLASPGGDLVLVLDGTRVVGESDGQVVVVRGGQAAVIALVVAALVPLTNC